MSKAFGVSAYSISIGVVVQAALIALGVFTLASQTGNGGDPSNSAGFRLHWLVGQLIIPVLAILLVVVAAIARKVPYERSTCSRPWWCRSLLVFVSYAVPALGVLHGVNAFVIIALAELGALRVRRAEPVAVASPSRFRVGPNFSSQKRPSCRTSENPIKWPIWMFWATGI